jgi:hypothetical protein
VAAKPREQASLFLSTSSRDVFEDQRVMEGSNSLIAYALTCLGVAARCRSTASLSKR